MPSTPIRTVKIPYKPRFPEIHKALETHRYCCLVFHRRAGKTVLTLNHLIKCALISEDPFALYGFLAPLKVQARSIAWEYLKYYTGTIPGRIASESHLSVKVPSHNGMAQIRLYGGDNPEALRGQGFSGIVIDEVSDIKPNLLDSIITPALSDKHGFLVLIGTPKGANHYHALYLDYKKRMEAGDPDYFACTRTVHDTCSLSEDEIQQLKNTMPTSTFERELECSFTVAAEQQLISLQSIYKAQSRRLDQRNKDDGAPLIIGVDVARYGDDNTCICIRRGAYVEPISVIETEDTMDTVRRVVQLYRERKPDGIMVESVGIGGPIIDRLRELSIPVLAVEPGGRAIDGDHFYNLRAEMWSKCRDFINKDGCIPPDEDLAQELATPLYEYAPNGTLKLESKKDIRKRIKRSTDRADSLCLTFAVPILSKKELDILNGSYKTIAEGVEDYEPLVY